MAIDPICGMTVDPDRAAGRFDHAGQTYWFCSTHCQQRFRADPANKGKIMDRGLWRYTRHPNYFGEACVWFGFLLIACDNLAGLVTIVSPAVMLYALMGPTGKALLERRMRKSRPDFDAYVQRTSGFFPLPPKSP